MEKNFDVTSAMETVAMASAGADIAPMDLEIAQETLAQAEKKEPAKRDPKANFHKLTKENQDRAELLVANLLDEIGGKEVDFGMLTGIIDLLNAEKKAAKEVQAKQEKERKAAEKELAQAQAGKLKDKLEVGDSVDYLLKSKNLLIKNVTIVKITDKRFHVELSEDTKVMNIKTNEAGTVADYGDIKVGKKYVAFEAIQNVNGMTPAEFMAA